MRTMPNCACHFDVSLRMILLQPPGVSQPNRTLVRVSAAKFCIQICVGMNTHTTGVLAVDDSPFLLDLA